ncbi:Signal transduction histidine kinase [Ruminococcaceae bacterium YRB3002]|nr:Signal transduction histidine kinase [Ruminococcaceae bacterium YRB3002]
MKFRIVVICWILLLGLCLIPMLLKPSVTDRDMVYYNTQVNAIAGGGAVPDGCSVVWCTDRDYEARINSFYRSGALVMDIVQDGVVTGKAVWDDQSARDAVTERNMLTRMMIIWGAVACAGTVLLVYVYITYIRPFKKLHKFAGEVARGNLDFPLAMGRNDFFGGFTESFDIMRTELKNARAKEASMQKAKQEMLAEISHDIRTPLATISATCEVLEVKNPTPEVTSKTAVIRAKAATIDTLISNMMSASLAEASELKVEPREESSLLIGTMVDNLHDVGEITVKGELPECLLYFDPLRLEQVIDNIVGNSLKYAGTPIEVEYVRQDKGVVIRISDKGPGVPEEELSLVTQKFYRATGSEGREGSGLGLYLADYFMKKMEGAVEFYNASEGGFVAEVFVRKV